jgi:hypothetical protein
MAATSDTEIKQSQAGGQTGGAQAGVGAEQRAAATGAGQAGVGASGQAAESGAGVDIGMDIGQTEAYTVNLKRLVAQELDHDAELRKIANNLAQRVLSNAQDYDHNLRQAAMQTLQNAISLANRVNNNSADLDIRLKNLSIDHDGRIRAFQEGEVARTVRHSDLAIDRQWNIDEVAELVAKTPVFLDAIAGAVAAGVAKAISKPAA